MILTEIPQAAGITGILCAAGLEPSQVHAWFHRRRIELTGLSPALVLMTEGRRPGRLVLALAQADALELTETGAIQSVPHDTPNSWAVMRGATETKHHAWEGSE